MNTSRRRGHSRAMEAKNQTKPVKPIHINKAAVENLILGNKA